jgi:hypothetical protein
MEDRTHGDVGKKVGAIVDNAISELLELGVESRDRACEMMACQAAIRISDNEIMKEVRQFVDESIWDVDDTTDGEGAAK